MKTTILTILVLFFLPACELLEPLNTQKSTTEETVNTDSEIICTLPFIRQQIPQLIGGLEGFYAQIVYPKAAIEAQIEGRVIIEFSVNLKGEPVKLKVLSKSLGYGLEEEAIRMLQSSRFTVYRFQGIPMEESMVLPIIFKL